jgi:hypothetical protein
MEIAVAPTTVKKKLEETYVVKIWRGAMPLPMIDQFRSILVLMYHEAGIDGYMSEKGYTDHAWDQIAAACNGVGELWVAMEGGKLLGFLLAGYNKDVDNAATYVLKQAWVEPSMRRTRKVKHCLATILTHAKSNFCRHVLLIASRNPRAYMRWLGRGWHQVTTVLKGDL